LQSGPWRGPAAEEKRGWPISGEGVAGGEGRGAKEHKEVTVHQLEVLGRAWMACGGLSTLSRRPAASYATAVALRRGVEGAAGLGSFSGARVS